jgi:radical SAM protein with 4Fe4S-binding SPASM domain
MTVVAEEYGAFSMGLHRKAQRERLPLDGTIEVTHRCPLTCAHCYNNLPMGDADARAGELTLDEHRRIAEEAAEAGCLWMLYTGGEIFARPDFLEIYSHAKRQGLLVTLFTNGILITPRIADYLAEWRPFSIEITLYGRTRETYERLTGIPGSFDRCMRGIDLLMERGLPLKLKTVAVSINRHEVREMKRFAEELGVAFKFDAMMNPRIDCSQSPLAVRLRPDEVVAFDLEDPVRVGEWQELARSQRENVRAHQATEDVYHCGGGMNAFAIDPYGRMSICVLSHFDTYDLRQGTFREGWDRFLGGVRQRKITRITKCRACDLKAMCSMCPANGELENGDPESPVDFLCHVAHLRAHAMGMEIPRHGDCEYCEGGIGHGELMDSLERLNRRLENGSRSFADTVFLPVLGEPAGCGSGGCSSCAAH